MRSAADTVQAYLATLPEHRRRAIEIVRQTILENLPDGYVEVMQYGMIGYVVPHSLWPQGYHCDPSQPLCFAGLASQKNHMAVYLMCVYGDPKTEAWFRAAYQKTGKKLDMGKSCVRFKKIEDAALDVIGEAIARVPVAAYLEKYQEALGQMKSRKLSRTVTSKKPSREAKVKASSPGTKSKGTGRRARSKARSLSH
jgi:Domain of unknown function (DU1801)